MAKKTQAAGDTRQKLIDDAKAKVAEVSGALDAAKAEFKAADSDVARADAQSKINAATEQLARFEAVLEALLKEPGAGGGSAGDGGEDDDGPSLRDFIVGGNGTIRHNGRDYAEGDTIGLTKTEFDQVAPLGVLAGRA